MTNLCRKEYRKECFKYVTLLKACAKKKDLTEGCRLHAHCFQRGSLQNSHYIASAVINMYAKCGFLVKAHQVLEELSVRNTVSWSALIAGYVQQGQSQVALSCFEMMLNEGLSPDVVTYSSILKACGDSRVIEMGQKIHEMILSGGLVKDIILGTSLVDMYAKCGMVRKAQEVLQELPFQDVVSWSALITGYAQDEQYQEALESFEMMLVEGHLPDAVTFSTILKVCGCLGDIKKGKQVHSYVITRDLFSSDIILGTAMVDMYAKCGVLAKALELFEALPVRNVVSWNALIAGYAHYGLGYESLYCFQQMQNEGVFPNTTTFLSILKACSTIRAIEEGKKIHDEVVNRGMLKKDVALGNALVDMYVKCGELTKAHKLLKELPVRTLSCWNSLIAGYVQKGEDHEALSCFDDLQNEGLCSDAITFASILKSCGKLRALEKGKKIHEEIVVKGLLESDIVLGNALVDMYTKCGFLEKAQKLLEELQHRDRLSWNALIRGYAYQGQGKEVLDCFEQMQKECFLPDSVTFICIMKACSITRSTKMAKQIHNTILSLGMMENDIAVGNSLVGMYAKCGLLTEAQQVLDELPIRDEISWNALITGFALHEQAYEALNCFQTMRNEGLSPDVITYTCILKACGSVGAKDKGREIHEEIERRGLLKNDIVLTTSLIDMYAKCGMVERALQLHQEFPVRDLVCWNALIAGHAQQGQGNEALYCIEQMHSEGLSPDTVTLTCVLIACGHIQAIDRGRQIHEEIVRQGLLNDCIMLGNALVDMYAKCGLFEKAEEVIEDLPFQNIVSWSSLIAGYVCLGECHAALDCFERMKSGGISPNEVTFVCILKACGIMGAISIGERIHEEIVSRRWLNKDIALGNVLVDMYARCGMLEKAQAVLEELPSRNVVTWNTLIAGYAQQGQGNNALSCFERMQNDGISPNEVSFLCALSACSHSGLMNETEMVLQTMKMQYGISPNTKHHTCMVMIFGFSGQFDKALSVIEAMPCADDPSVWLALLSACKKWGNTRLGQLSFNQVIQLDLSNGAAYALMTGIFKSSGMNRDAESLEVMKLKFSSYK